MSGQLAQNGAMAMLAYLTGNATVPTPGSAPTLGTATTGGTVAAGTYQVKITYVSPLGESAASASASIVTTGSTSTITITSPGTSAGATGWNAYVTQAGGSTYYLQEPDGNPTAIGTNLVLTAPPTNTGPTAPASFAGATSSGLYLALLTADPSTSGASGAPAVYISDLVEDTTAGYARQAVTFSEPTVGEPATASNTATITFGPYTANQSIAVQWAALVTASSGANGLLLYTWSLDTIEQVQVSQPIVIPAGDLLLTQQ